METKETFAKSILTPSKLPDADYVINPYTGCRYGCTYCYASFMSRYVGKDIKEWGNFVYAKVNAPELLKTDLAKLKNNGVGVKILFSSVTDPYQGLEAKYQLTRKCLEVLVDYGFEGTVGLLTKSDMILRDLAILKKLKHVDIGFTITSTDDAISKYFEQYAPSASQRLKALKEVNAAGLPTYAFVGPLLPHFVSYPEKLDELFGAIKAAGTTEVYVEHINLSNYILNRLKAEMPTLDKEILGKFYASQDKSYRIQLDAIVNECVKKYGLHMRLGGALYHKEL